MLPCAVKDEPAMDQPLLLQSVRTKKDVIVARQRARRIAGMLGFDCRAQAEIAAATFYLALDALKKTHGATLRFQVDEKELSVVVEAARGSAEASPPTPGLFRLQRPLAAQSAKLSSEDRRFIATTLASRTRPDLFAEVEKQNQELMQALLELCEAERRNAQGERRNISAA